MNPVQTVFSLLLLLYTTEIFGQYSLKDIASHSCNLTWLGVDFTQAKFIGKEGFVSSETSMLVLINEWNDIIVKEPKKYDLLRFFHTSTLKIDDRPVYLRNSIIDTSKLVIDNPHTIENKHIQVVVDELVGLDNPDGGIGIVLIVESFSKLEHIGRGYLIFFDPSTKSIIYSKKLEAAPSGSGLRNYWANSIYGMLEQSEKILKAEIFRKN